MSRSLIFLQDLFPSTVAFRYVQFGDRITPSGPLLQYLASEYFYLNSHVSDNILSSLKEWLPHESSHLSITDRIE